MQNPLYFLDNKPYINMTNACTNACVFCIRNEKDDVQGTNMWLEHEVSAKDVIEQIEKDIKKVLSAGSIVFCGYGEPLIKLNEVIEISKYLKKKISRFKNKNKYKWACKCNSQEKRCASFSPLY